MTALEFQTTSNASGTVTIPPELAKKIPAESPIRVVLLVGEEDTEPDWSKMTTEQFFKGYANNDAIYDQLSSG